MNSRSSRASCWREVRALSRLSLLLLALTALALTSIAHGAGGPDAWRTGDASCNGRIDAVDASLDLQWDARLLDALPCFRAADGNNDYAVDSLDALLVLQQEAALIDRLGVEETLLCPAPAGKGRYGNIDEEIDLTGDGTPEVVSVHLFPEENEAKLGVAAYVGDTLQTIVETVVPTFFFDPNGPDTWWTHVDLTGDGNDEAVLCVTAFGANDPFTSAVIYSFDGGSLSTLMTLLQVPSLQLSTEGSTLVGSSRLDWFAGDCEEIRTEYNDWVGAELVSTHSKVTHRFHRGDCADVLPVGQER